MSAVGVLVMGLNQAERCEWMVKDEMGRWVVRVCDEAGMLNLI